MGCLPESLPLCCTVYDTSVNSDGPEQALAFRYQHPGKPAGSVRHVASTPNFKDALEKLTVIYTEFLPWRVTPPSAARTGLAFLGGRSAGLVGSITAYTVTRTLSRKNSGAKSAPFGQTSV
jgi:hypothetical protein